MAPIAMAMPTKTHDIGINPLPFHDDKGNQHADRQGDDADQGAAQMKEKYDTYQGNDQALFDQGPFQVVDRPDDKPGAIIDRSNGNPFGQVPR